MGFDIHEFLAELNEERPALEAQFNEMIDKNQRDLRIAQAVVVFTSALGAGLVVFGTLAQYT